MLLGRWGWQDGGLWPRCSWGAPWRLQDIDLPAECLGSDPSLGSPQPHLHQPWNPIILGALGSLPCFRPLISGHLQAEPHSWGPMPSPVLPSPVLQCLGQALGRSLRDPVSKCRFAGGVIIGAGRGCGDVLTEEGALSRTWLPLGPWEPREELTTTPADTDPHVVLLSLNPRA